MYVQVQFLVLWFFGYVLNFLLASLLGFVSCCSVWFARKCGKRGENLNFSTTFPPFGTLDSFFFFFVIKRNVWVCVCGCSFFF